MTDDQQRGLRATLKSSGASLKSLTVLAPQNDPFRVDTDAGHRDGKWLRDMMAELRLSGPRHLRGLHYALIGQPKPNGLPYTNTDADWQWLATPAKCARWLGYIPFDRIVDQRNDKPEVRLWTPPREPMRYISNGGPIDITLPDVSQFRPRAMLTGFHSSQPYHSVLVGEKSSLRPVLSRIADRYEADLYLPTGEISDTQVHAMAASVIEDDRPMVIFYFSDCDPAGWQMPISLARKLQALRAMKFPQLDFEVHRVGLTPEQVRQYGLPSTPLKDTEKRADKWQAAMGVEQTEIDALAALQPRLLEDIANAAVSPYYDRTLSSRVWEAQQEWQRAAQQLLDSAVDTEHLEQLRAETELMLEEKREEIQELLESVRVDPKGVKLPPIPELPEPEVSPIREPLCSSRWDFIEQCHALIESKNYAGGAR